MDELNLAPGELTSVRLAAWLSKRSSGVLGGWSQRYVVLAGNFLYVYVAPTDAKPRRVVCVDEAVTVVRIYRGARKGLPGTIPRSYPPSFSPPPPPGDGKVPQEAVCV